MSQHGVEFLKLFLMPFLRSYDPGMNLDDAVAAWFNLDKRTMVEAEAKRAFRMPGYVALAAGGKWSARAPHREIVKGQKMLMVIDSKDQTTKVDVVIEKKDYTFRLTRAETVFLKDQVNWRQV
jgi:hypothetical protein